MAIIDKPTDYFNTVLYSGNASNPRTLSGLDFQPDWVWLKNRTDGNGHTLADAVRGANKTLSSDGTDAEITDKSDGHLDAFTSDGFTVGAGSSSDGRVNDGSHTYVAWNWKAGTSFTNDASATGIGSFDSSGSVNTDAGFSIISYTGNGNDDDTAKIAHGLGVAANMIIVKCRNAAGGWQTSSTSLGFNNVLQLNETNAQASGTYAFGRTGVAPTSTVFTVSATSGGNHTNTNNNTYIAYCFAEKQGYSKFGSYTGNGNADGTFVYTGFKPAWFMVKRTDSADGWGMFDNKRDPHNQVGGRFWADEASAESTGQAMDFLSNGFKIRATNAYWNASGGSYIYMAFAENPFVTSTANGSIPATAR